MYYLNQYSSVSKGKLGLTCILTYTLVDCGQRVIFLAWRGLKL